MSATTLRFHPFTFAFLPVRRSRRIESVVRNLQLRVSTRRLKRAVRSVFP